VASYVVVVEDDASIGQAMQTALASHGYRVEWCRDGASATTSIEQQVPDLLLLDAGLPDVDGFSLCRWIREHHRDLPIVLVTARDSDIDMVVGLDAGASDYVTKPFSMNVLLARVRAHLRHAETTDPTAAITIGSLVIDPAAYLVWADGEPVDLRPREFELLLLLARESGKVMTRERLLSEVWDLHWDSSTKTLDMHVLALRRKLGSAIDIATVRGVGYRLDAP
jgi:DNA-binding response OmpR family regulator